MVKGGFDDVEDIGRSPANMAFQLLPRSDFSLITVARCAGTARSCTACARGFAVNTGATLDANALVIRVRQWRRVIQPVDLWAR